MFDASELSTEPRVWSASAQSSEILEGERGAWPSPPRVVNKWVRGEEVVFIKYMTSKHNSFMEECRGATMGWKKEPSTYSSFLKRGPSTPTPLE